MCIDVINDNPQSIRIPSKGNLVGVIDILDEIHVEFDIIIHSFSAPSRWVNILHFGNTADEYYPAIYLDTANQCCFYVEFSSIQNPTQHWVSYTETFNLSTTYHIKFTITHDSVLFTVDNQVVVDDKDSNTILSHAILFNKNIYISSPFMDTLNCTLYALKVITSTSEIPYNYLCDYANRFTIKSGSWIYDYASCTLTQTNTTHQQASVWIDKHDTTSVHWTDYNITTQFKITIDGSLVDTADAGPLFRAASSGNYFRVFGEVGVLGLIAFEKYISGTQSCLDSYFNSLTVGVTHTLSIVAVGCTFNIYLDHVHQFELTECSYSAGTVGLQTFEAEVEFLSLYLTFPDDGQLYTLPPTTIPPTNSPSINPSAAPSIIPTVSPSKVPITPTDIQDLAINDIRTTLNDMNENNGNKNNSGENGLVTDLIGSYLMWIVIGGVLLCCLLVCGIGLVYYTRKRNIERIKSQTDHITTKCVSTGDSDKENEIGMQQNAVRDETDFDIDNVDDLPEDSSQHENAEKIDSNIGVTDIGMYGLYVTPIQPMGIATIGQSSQNLMKHTVNLEPDTASRLDTYTPGIDTRMTTQTENENENEFDDMYTDMTQNPTPMGDNDMVTPE